MKRNRSNPAEEIRTCTCRNTGRCGYCPSIAITATRQGQVSGSGQSGAAGRAAADRIARRSAGR